MVKTPRSAGDAQQRSETIEMSSMEGRPTGRSRVTKTLSQPSQTIGRVELSTAGTSMQGSFERGQSIRGAVVDFVGISEKEPDKDPEMDRWRSRRLQFINRNYKFSKEFQAKIGKTGDMTPGPSTDQPQTPGFFTDDESRPRSSSIESRPRSHTRRESAFKIVYDNVSSLIIKGRLTPTHTSTTRIRRGGDSSFVVSESPLATLSSPTTGIPQSPFGVSSSSAMGAASSHIAGMRMFDSRPMLPLVKEDERESFLHDITPGERDETRIDSEQLPSSSLVTSIAIDPEKVVSQVSRMDISPSPPPPKLTRPNVLPMDDLSSATTLRTDEVFFDVECPSRPIIGLDIGIPILRTIEPSLIHGLIPRPIRLDGDDRGRGMARDMEPIRPPIGDIRGRPRRPSTKYTEKSMSVLSNVARLVQEGATEQHRVRQGGEGVFGRCIGRKMKPKPKDEYQRTLNERPFFTVWITLAQVLICFLSIIIFGIVPFSFSLLKKEGEVQSLDQTLITVGVYEKGNIWLGPGFADLIRLGAKYSPCMRAEVKIIKRIELDRLAESHTGCCIHTNGICYQAGDQLCPRTLATLIKLRSSSPRLGVLRKSHSSPDLIRHQSLSTQRNSEIVCGLDPDYCSSPTYHSFSREDITKWPMCMTELSERETSIRPRHLTCKVQGRPCCIHLQGRCRITTREYCEFVNGIFHEDASLCSQVNCLHDICGMIPFGESPNQYYRLFISLFLHAGVLHLFVTVIFQLIFMRDLELYIGWMRMAFIYFISGVGGNLASAIFVPFNPEVGPSGAHAGIVAALFVDVYCNRADILKPGWAFLQNGLWILLLFVVGIFPWVDNWAMLFGTIFGFCAALVFFPDVGLSRGPVFRKLIVFTGVLSILALFLLLYFIFSQNWQLNCSWCGYFNCINWYKFFNDSDEGNHFCDNQGLQLDSWLPI